jgi:hypothetical protein
MFLYSEDTNDLLLDAYKNEISTTESALKTYQYLPASAQNSTKHFLKSLSSMQTEWKNYHNQYSLIIRILFEIINSFPSENKSVTDDLKTFSNTTNYVNLYVQICNLMHTSANESKKFVDYEQFQNLKKLLQLSSSSTFNDIVNKLLKVISTINTDNYSAEFLKDLIKLNELLEHQLIEQNIVVYNNQSDNEENEEEAMIISPKKMVKRSQSVSRKSTKPLLDNSNISQDQSSPTKDVLVRRRKTQSNVMNNLNLNRSKFIDWLTNQFSRQFDVDYTKVFLYSKYFCYDNLEKVKENLFVNQRISIHDGLVNPFKYLKKKENAAEIKHDRELLPICIIYKIYLECGHMINLYDWLQVCD